MSTKNKKIVYYLAAFLVVLMLVCTCLLGNTFARYVTGVSGNASAEVADWTVSTVGTTLGSTGYICGELSPDIDGTQGGTNVLYQSSSPTQVAKITITDATTDVSAQIKISATTLQLNSSGTTAYVFGSNAGITDSSSPAATRSEAYAVFTLHVGWASATTDTAPTVVLADNGTISSGLTEIDIDGGFKNAYSWTNNTDDCYVYIYAWVTWKTDYSVYNTQGTNSDGKNDNGVYYADALDTWIAENIDNVSTTITAQAVQITEIPTA